MSFTHLRVRSHHSLKEGLMDPQRVAQKAAELGQQSVALTDLGTLSGLPAFYATAKENNVKPIFGVDLRIETDLSDPENTEPTRLLLLAENDTGYRKLMEILTRANVENNLGPEQLPLFKQSWFEEVGTEGLIALSGTPEFGEIPRMAMQEDKHKASTDVKRALGVYRKLFGANFFLEVSRFAHEKEDLWVQRMVVLSTATNTPLVATHGVMFEERQDFFAHEVHTAITIKKPVTDPDYKALATREQYFLSTEEMEELFSDIPQAVENAKIVGMRCTLTQPFGENHLPKFPLPEGESNIDDYFVKLSRKGLDERLQELFPDPSVRATKVQEYSERLEEEIGIILGMGFPGYFLVVSDFIRWSKSQGIPVGPGRGSGAGSLVAYVLNITDIDPIEHSLLFERFLNPERVSMPDIDVDFCRDRRDETVKYIFDHYGHASVAQIATINTLAARASIRHAGTALNYPLPYIIEIANMVPKSPDMTLKMAFELEPKLVQRYENDRRATRLLNMAMKLEKTSLTTGVHAGGVVISPTLIEDFAPMMRSEKGVMVTQFDKNDVEKAGLIKFDILGLKTLTLIDGIVKLVNQREEFKDQPFDLRKINQNDPQAMELLREGRTYGVFQLEKRGITNLLKKIQPEVFEDVATVLALYRPGPLQSGMVDTFVNRKRGEEEPTYFHPKLEKILKPTYGVIVYQEQVMQIAREIAGYSLGGADLLRRAMGKKDPAKMAKERYKFEEGAAANGVDKELATTLFDLMEKFAAYGFNRSHSAAYAVVSLQTAALKARYPAEFFTAYMNVERESTDVLDLAVKDARSLGLEILPPDVNKGEADFKVESENQIRYGLSGLKGVSPKIVDDIVAARTEYGDFESLLDFLTKVNTYLREHGRNAQLKTVAEKLIKAGAFDSIEPHRALLLQELSKQQKYIGDLNKRSAAMAADKGEVLLPNLWSSVGVEAVPAPPKTNRRQPKPLIAPEWPDPNSVKMWDDIEKLDHEKNALGFHFSGHAYGANMRHFQGLDAAMRFNEVEEYDNPYQTVLLAGVVVDVFERTTTSGANEGRKWANIRISDGKQELRVAAFSEAYAQWEGKLKVGQFVGFEASIRESKNPQYPDKNINAQQIMRAEDLEALLVNQVHIVAAKEDLEVLQNIHQKFSGDRVECIAYIPDGEDRYFKAKLPHIKFNGSVECLAELRSAFPNRLHMEFAPSVSFAPAPRKSNQNKNGGFRHN